MIAHATDEHVTSVPAVTSCNNRRAAESGVAMPSGTWRTVPLQWNTWYHANHINRERGVLLGPHRDYITRPTELRWGESTVVGHSPAGKNVNTEAEDTVNSRYQTAGEHTADWEDVSVCCSELVKCELAIALELLVVTICKCSINPIINPNPIYSHSYMCQ
jgi:hypothetical protein